MNIAFYGSSLLSSYWNGAATYYRGILHALAKLGHRITFYEPDAFDRQKHRDIEPPDWARVVVYPANATGLAGATREAAAADVVVKASGVGVFDDELIRGVTTAARPGAVRIFWDVDAPATLAEIAGNGDHPIRECLDKIDVVLTYGGGTPVVESYMALGATCCVPIYNALDPDTHRPVQPNRFFAGDLAFLGNRLPDRETRVERFFLEPARHLPEYRFVLGGAGWETKELPANVRHVGHVYTRDHNAFNVTPLAVLNVARDSMAATGYSPATRVFEAAGAGACIITDAWEGLGLFLAEAREVLVARDGADVVEHLRNLTPERAREIGRNARRRVLAQHTYDRRAALVQEILLGAARLRSAA